MTLVETYLVAQRTILRNVLRSSLTILGIVIGVAAVITMVTIGSGATAKVTSDISKLGSNILHVRPGQGFRGPGEEQDLVRILLPLQMPLLLKMVWLGCKLWHQ